MFILDSQDLVFSATDVVTAAKCEFALLRRLDEKLGRVPKLVVEDPMRERASKLGDRHEQAVLADFRAAYGIWSPGTSGGVAEIAEAAEMDRAVLAAKHEESLAPLRDGADVVYQAGFFDGEFHGRSDFLVRQPDRRYQVFDTKLARHAKVEALLQLAAYGEQLAKAGFEPSDEVTLILGTGDQASFSLHDLLPAYRERRRRVTELTSAHLSQGEPAVWEAPGVAACGRCEYCAVQAAEHRDVLLVAGMSLSRRKKLREAGIRTIDELAASREQQDDATLARLREQARFQSGVEAGDGGALAPAHGEEPEHEVRFKVLPTHTIAALPRSSAGDVYFDFEGDPLWQDPETRVWGIEYLFGVLEPPVEGAAPVFKPFLAHTMAEEKAAFLDFVDYIEDRRNRFPDMHVYHYASYEKTALRRLAQRHAAAETVIDAWLREGLLVDLYETVRHSIRISERSYSIKKLEPLYMGAELRTAELQSAAGSVEMYASFCTARDLARRAAADGDFAESEARGAEAQHVLDLILEYNKDDCVSTLRLDEWLRELAATHPGAPPVTPRHLEPPPDADAEQADGPLLEYLAQRGEHGTTADDGRAQADDVALALLAAAVQYWPREKKSYWWAHFDRLERPLSELEGVRNAFVVRSAEVLSGWQRDRQTLARTVKLRGQITPGSDFREGSSWFREFAQPLPAPLEPTDGQGLGRNGWNGTIVLGIGAEDGDDVLTVREKTRKGVEPYDQLPVALTEEPPLGTKSIEAAQAELARLAADALPAMLEQPAVDLLRRLRPRTLGAVPLPEADGPGTLPDAIEAAVRVLDRSYLAVQGPPGSGKTFVASRVIARLVQSGWKVGVVGNSHAVVENVLCRAIDDGVPRGLVAKKPKDGPPEAAPLPWPVENQSNEAVEALLSGSRGCLVGGTAWTMTGASVPPGSLDLLVIDEAGQFSLANTIAVSRAASRLLLLGDPQQLPQVSQGQHPEPVNESALGWLAQGHAVLPAEFGYFLSESWRMSPLLCEAVSRLSYAGRLRSAPAARERTLEGAPAGVETVFVDHSGNATSSREEAEEVVRRVRQHVGLRWTEDAVTRSLEPQDVIVVAAYNAQVNLIREALDRAGLHESPVGTVDRFQGQEAVVAIVSLACSDPGEAPRGMEFLINRNRINVAVSRAKWRAVVVRSPGLTVYLPSKPEALEELGAFIGLCGG
ncbi:TM0106 family RecB-like putative nuclease [Sinomonas sp. ASV322]|uniref:TM0106 family RecB-like putative nuclease n=1 Tax=Sinomonas sp. ASV322 TaxID=3041920 RepID=UPI0027DC8069|nr:TM0106 family RecB-like putative nuclease [Sinomonas sp. ASV322]MDQ4503079.1 TM0106 family RecB-like putative nuclease [Sinomonas sp. ASV322]